MATTRAFFDSDTYISLWSSISDVVPHQAARPSLNNLPPPSDMLPIMTDTQEQIFSSPTAGAFEAIHGRTQSPRSSARQTLTPHGSAPEPLAEISLGAAALRYLGSPYWAPSGGWARAHWGSWFGMAEGEEDYLDDWDFVDDLEVPYNTVDEGSDDSDDADDTDDADDVEGQDDGDDSDDSSDYSYSDPANPTDSVDSVFDRDSTDDPAGPVFDSYTADSASDITDPGTCDGQDGGSNGNDGDDSDDLEPDSDDEPANADRDLEHDRWRLNMAIHRALARSVIAAEAEPRALKQPREGARAALGHYGPRRVSTDVFPRTIQARARPFTIWED